MTPAKELVWVCHCSLPGATAEENTSTVVGITAARRYSPEQVRFLKEGVRARPQ